MGKMADWEGCTVKFTRVSQLVHRVPEDQHEICTFGCESAKESFRYVCQQVRGSIRVLAHLLSVVQVASEVVRGSTSSTCRPSGRCE